MSDATGRGARGLAAPRVVAVAGVVAVVLAGAGLGVLLDADPGPTGDEVLERAAARYDDAESYAGTVDVTTTVTNDSGTRERSARVRVLYRAPDDHRVEVLAPDRVAGTVAATDGSTAWISRGLGTTTSRELNETPRSWLDRLNLSAVVDRLRENASATRRGTATVDGHETYVVEVRPDEDADEGPSGGANGDGDETNRWPEGTVNATVWVDTDDYRIRKLVVVGSHENTTVRTTMHFRDFAFGIDIHESTFRPPRSRSIVLASLDRTTYDSLSDARANLSFPVATPGVPDGFDLQQVVVSRRGENATLTATYSNGSDRLVVVQSQRDPLSRIESEVETETVRVGPYEGSFAELENTNVVFWRMDGRTYAVAGPLGRERLVAIAESMVLVETTGGNASVAP